MTHVLDDIEWFVHDEDWPQYQNVCLVTCRIPRVVAPADNTIRMESPTADPHPVMREVYHGASVILTHAAADDHVEVDAAWVTVNPGDVFILRWIGVDEETYLSVCVVDAETPPMGHPEREDDAFIDVPPSQTYQISRWESRC